jgi:glutamine amidotransferase
MLRLKKKNLIDILSEEVLVKEKFFLGICVGMQVLSTVGYEFEKISGLDWIKGEVRKINASKLRLPHIGWNNIKILKSNIIDNSINNLDFYFLHSYIFLTKDSCNTVATTLYGEEFSSVISYKNIWGFQFHPEKSQLAGKKILLNFFSK